MSLQQTAVPGRIATIDVLRGLTMVVMALDHTRDYFHEGAMLYDPTDLDRANPALFLTRWITHFCAPAFVFLAGLSVYIKRKTSAKKDVSMYLLTRGLWLMFLDVVVFRFALLFNFYMDFHMLSILWMIGCCMVMLAGLIYLRHWAILAISLIIIFGHNLTDGYAVAPESAFYIPWVILWTRGLFQLAPGVSVYSIYAVIPWLGIMMFGYCMGRFYGPPYTDKMRRRLFTYVGVLAIILFVFFRESGFYGDPRPAQVYPDFITSALSILNVTKYPVSLQFTLMTIGPLMILLAVLENVNLTRLRPVIVFGRVPLFYFIAHFFVIHSAALAIYMIQKGKRFSEVDFHYPATLGGVGPDGGVSLPWVYLAWISVVVALYPICVWFEKYKRERRAWWTSYL
jgi:uncharacterized membrane protein